MIKHNRDSGRELLVSLFRTALASVHGRPCVAHYLQANKYSGKTSVIAIGKAACAMMDGALDVLQDAVCAGLVISPPGQGQDNLRANNRITRVNGNHPVPGAESLAAGEQLLDFIERSAVDSQLLFLLSGGTSSLVEVPEDGVSLADLQRANHWLLGSGLDIVQINLVRKALSRIKGGQLCGYLGDRVARVLLLSDVPGDDPGTIGSGLLHSLSPPREEFPQVPDWLHSLLDDLPKAVTTRTGIEHSIIGTNRTALDAIREQASQDMHVEIDHVPLTGDVLAAAAGIVSHLREAPAGLYIRGGETTVQLPDNPGQGGRNQQLALAVALSLRDDEPLVLLAAGTDGRDGPGEAAGAVVDAQTVRRGEAGGLNARNCLQQADAGSFLQASGDLLQTGPTGTNVMDIVIALKFPEIVH